MATQTPPVAIIMGSRSDWPTMKHAAEALDRLGHAAGDAALVHVAEMMRANLRESDAVGRLGGDEFGLLMLNAGLEEGREKARRLAAALEQSPFEWEGQAAGLGGSFGVRAFAGHTDPEVWLAEADAAMWVRKKGR